MSVFGRIMSAIFGQSAAANQVTDTAAAGSAPPAAGAPGADPAQSTQAASQAAPTSTAAPGGQPTVDVAQVLDGLASKNREKLDWRHSIVDLMKLLDIDSSFAARKELAQELHYDGDTGDSAKMNMWLHKQVMKKLQDNGGKLPSDLGA